MSRVLITGYYGFGNAGDEAILASMISGLRERRREIEIVVVSGNPGRTTALHGVPAVPRDDIPGLVEAVRSSDLVILGGGGLLQDYWPTPAEDFLTPWQGGLYTYLALPVLAALTNRPFFLYAIGVGPLATEEGRELTRVAFALARGATVRDPESLDLLRSIGIPRESLQGVEIAADPAFDLPAARLAPDLGLPAEGGPVLGVVLRPWNFSRDRSGEWEAEVGRALDRLVAEAGARIVFLPFDARAEGEDDAALQDRVRRGMAAGGRTSRLAAGLPPGELAGALSRCDLVLAMRYHAALFALSAGVPTVGLAYDPKLAALMDGAGLGESCLPPERWTEPELFDALERARHRPPARPPHSFARRMRGSARKSVDAVVEILEEGPPPALREAEAFLRKLALEKALSVAGLRWEREGLQADLGRLRGELESQVRRVQSQGEEIADQRELLREQRERLRDQREQLEELRLQSERQWEQVQEQREERKRFQKWLAAAQEEKNLAEEAGRRVREQRELLLRERNALARRLEELEQALAIRFVYRVWRATKRLFPEGSQRKIWYRRFRDLVARQVGSGGPPLPDARIAVPAGQPAVPAPDFRGDLLRFEERVQRSAAPRVVVFASATQLLESEGQRPTQLALELARRGIPVVFLYFRWWKTEWCPQDRLDEGILQIPLDLVTDSPELLATAFSGRERVLLVEFPHPSFFDLLAAAASEGWLLVYDVLDDWEEFHRVGQAIWYDEPFERHVIVASDAVFAINEVLAGRIRELGGAGVEVVGNGLKPGLEVVREPRPLERGEVTVGYFGYLAGAWFDWELLAEAARRQRSWRFYLIGYGGSPEGVKVPGNVVPLGKQPQGDLAAYAENWDVAIIPFKPDRLAAGADPIKTYEYLAMGLPVVTTGVYPPTGGEGLVVRAETVDDFLQAVSRAAVRDPEAVAARRAFAAASTWGCRLDEMFGTLDRGGQRVAEKKLLMGVGS